MLENRAPGYGGPVRYRFGEFELDQTAFELRRGGTVVPLQAKVFELLFYLVQRRDRAVARGELLSALWPDVHVSDSALAWCVSQARKALGQERGDSEPIETLHGRGYRFRGDVETIGGSISPPPPEPPATGEPALSRNLNRFVGRERTMQTLRAAFDRARQSGQGTGHVLVGEAGIGKTRCALELAAEVRAQGNTVWFARCHEAEGTPVLWPWIQLLRACARDPEKPVNAPAAAELLASLVPESDEKMESAFKSGRSGTFWLLDSLVGCLLAYAALRPRLVIVDDLQWADDLSLRALELLAPELPSASMLVVATLRSDEQATPPSGSSLTRLTGRLAVSPLHGLSRRHLEEYVEAAIGRAPERALLDAVLEKTAGNPLFVEEVIRQRAEQEPFSNVPPAELRIPRVARDLIQARLDRYDVQVRRALEAASILGEGFEMPVLAAMLGMSSEELLPSLDIAVRAHLIAPPTAVGRYSFTHGLVREAVQSEFSETARRELHRKAGEALESQAMNDEPLNQLAFHFHQALPLGPHTKAVRYSMAAARAASNMFAHDAARTHFMRALEAHAFDPAPDPETRSQILLELAATEIRLGLWREANEHLALSIGVAKQHGLAAQLIAAGRVLRRSVASFLPPSPAARAAVETGLALLAPDDSVNRASALSQLAAIAASSLTFDQSRELSLRAVEIARPVGGHTLAEALWSRIFALTGPDTIDELLEVTNEMLRQGDPDSSPWSGEAHYAQFCAHLLRGAMPSAELALEAYGRAARAKRLHEVIWAYDRLRAQIWFQRGEFELAERMWLELAERGEKTQAAYERTVYKTHSAALNRERGIDQVPSDETKAIFARWLALGPRYREGARQIVYMLETGQLEAAKVSFEALVKPGLALIPRDLGYLAALASLSVAAIALGERTRAEELYDALLPYSQFSTPDSVAFTMGSVSQYLGRLAAFLGRSGAAREHFEVALARNAEMGLRPALAHTHLAYARFLSASGAASPRRESAAAAVRIAEELGMQKVLAESIILRDKL